MGAGPEEPPKGGKRGAQTHFTTHPLLLGAHAKTLAQPPTGPSRG